MSDHKAPDAYRTISEAADIIGVPQHVLRFWETKFSFVRPMKRAGGRRLYRPQDLDILKAVKRLLHDDGMTIKGVQKLHRTHGLKAMLQAGEGAPAVMATAPSAADKTDEPSAPNAAPGAAAPQGTPGLAAVPLHPHNAEAKARLDKVLDTLLDAQARLKAVQGERA